MHFVTSFTARTLARTTIVALLSGCAIEAAIAADPVRDVEVHGSGQADHVFEVYGFAQVDYIQDFSGRMDPAWQDAFRPSKIDVGNNFGDTGQASISVKQSRLGVRGTMPSGGSLPIAFKFEFDLYGTGADAGQTTIRPRHMYGEWGALLAGQTNTQFMDGDVFPNVIDYWGPTGMAFTRLPQIRWTAFKNDTSHFSIAIERPGNDVDAGNVRLVEGWDDAQIQGDQRMPDFTAQWRTGGDWGHFQVAGLYRDVGYEYRATSAQAWQRGSDPGWGINLSTAINTFGKDKLLLQALHGDGIATYLNDGGMDLAPRIVSRTPTLSVTGEAVPLTGIMAYYDHYWNDTWSSSIGYSYTEVDNTDFQDPSTFRKGDYASVNLLATPAKNLLIGGEFLWGKKTTNNGASDDDTRFQFSVKYSFSSIP